MLFQPWPKTPRLNKGMVITEKIDGTNSAVIIEEVPEGADLFDVSYQAEHALLVDIEDLEKTYVIGAQSRTRLLTPTKAGDNYGFAKWVWSNAENLILALGPGRHFGEWWGGGIQRGYGLTKANKRFSLFNVNRYKTQAYYAEFDLPNVSTVPILNVGPFDTEVVRSTLAELLANGSSAAPGYMKPEGVVVFHEGSNGVFKVLAEHDEIPKSLVSA